MLIQNLEQKTRLALLTVVIVVIGNAVICLMLVAFGYKVITNERKQVYILDGDIPFLAERSELEVNFVMEAKADIQLFHHYFFTLAPDDEYIKWTVNKAMNMADGSALRQKQAMSESGFFNDIVSSSAVCTIMCDSINLNEKAKSFTYYGTQTIRRPSKTERRRLITSGVIVNSKRSENNPHGMIITRWHTVRNETIKE